MIINYATKVVNYATKVVNYAPRVINYAPKVTNYTPRRHSTGVTHDDCHAKHNVYSAGLRASRGKFSGSSWGS